VAQGQGLDNIGNDRRI